MSFPVEATSVSVLMFAIYATLSNAEFKTLLGKHLPWKICLIARWDVCFEETLFFNRLVFVVINDKHAPYGVVPLATGAILDKNRLLTSYNPFKKYIKDRSMINEISVQLTYGVIKTSENTFCNHLYGTHELWSGRQVTYTPDEEIPDKSWHGREADKHSPLHDLMVLRVKPNFDHSTPFSNKQEHEIKLGTYDNVFTMNIAEAGYELEYPLRYAQLSTDKGFSKRSIETYNFVSSDDVVMNCDNYIPKYFGIFICLKNIHQIQTLVSSAILVSNQTVVGIGSFMYVRGDINFLVFTDVRPYQELIMNAMSDEDTESGAE